MLDTLLDEDCQDVLEGVLEGHRGQPLLGAFPVLAEPPLRPGGGPRDLPLDPKTPPQRSLPELPSAQLFFGPLTLLRGLYKQLLTLSYYSKLFNLNRNLPCKRGL